jgi:hypothetical protein
MTDNAFKKIFFGFLFVISAGCSPRAQQPVPIGEPTLSFETASQQCQVTASASSNQLLQQLLLELEQSRRECVAQNMDKVGGVALCNSSHTDWNARTASKREFNMTYQACLAEKGWLLKRQ